MARLLFAALVAAVALEAAASEYAIPAWGAKQSSPVATAPTDLRPGDWIWNGAASPSGPIAVIVSLTEQRAYVYRDGILIATTTVSTGKPGYETPVGVFTILQMDKYHRSNKYSNAPMPYQQRLTMEGVALHAGGLPGYPESHGCVHLPTEFARLLFEASHMGMTVVVAREGQSPEDVVHPGALMPVDDASGAQRTYLPLAAGESFRWQPESAPEGHVSLLLSGADRRLLVFRNGIEIGRARIDISDPERPLGTHVYVVKRGNEQAPRWFGVGIPGSEADADRPLTTEAMNRVKLSREFVARVYPLLVTGVTLMVTDQPVLPATTGRTQQVLDALPPEG
jgi:hypothetical protein